MEKLRDIIEEQLVLHMMNTREICDEIELTRSEMEEVYETEQLSPRTAELLKKNLGVDFSKWVVNTNEE